MVTGKSVLIRLLYPVQVSTVRAGSQPSNRRVTLAGGREESPGSKGKVPGNTWGA
jgi:hypothetical protein